MATAFSSVLGIIDFDIDQKRTESHSQAKKGLDRNGGMTRAGLAASENFKATLYGSL